MKTKRKGPVVWIKDRMGAKPIEKNVVRRRVPKSRWYYGGGSALLLLLLVLVTTGAFLALTYKGSTTGAYESIVEITKHSTLGWFVRAIHYWAGGAMVIVMLMHMIRQILLGGYLPPREGTWLVGIGMFVLVVINSFTGYTLRWDERSIYAIRVALNMFHYVPFIGNELVQFVQGGWTLGDNTLTRLYAVHVLFVPLSLFALVGYHLYLVILHGVTTLVERKHPVETAEEQRELYERLKKKNDTGESFYPDTVAKSGGFSLVVLVVIIALAALVGPQELYPRANLSEDSFPREEWWFSWYSALIAYLPPSIAPIVYVALPIVTLLFLFSLPFVDGKANRGLRRRPVAAVGTGLVIIGLLVLTGLRQRSPWTGWPRSELPPVPERVHLTESAVKGRILFTKRGCYNCHAISGQGPEFGPNLSAIQVRLSQQELRNYILQPPAGVPMPAYRGKLTEAELAQIVDFVLAAQTFPRKIQDVK